MRSMLLATFLAVVHLTVADDYCFGKDRERTQTRHFSSKTAYQIVKGLNMERQKEVPGCEPSKLWIFHRHGTRLPSKKFIESVSRLDALRELIVENYRVRHTKPDVNALCNEDFSALLMWHWNSSIQPDQANFLTAQGYEDVRGTAKLYQRYFPGVLTRPYDPNHYLFRHTNIQRTIESFKGFAEGLFGDASYVEAHSTNGTDLVLRPYDSCSSWQENDDDASEIESKKFRELPLWKNMVSDISSRLGFRYNLSDSDIDKMFDICRYEQAWQVDRTSVWCAVFLPEHVTILEYDEDLKYYQKFGYGFAENQRMGCGAVKDMLDHFNSDQEPIAVVNFGHSSGLQVLLTTLGINKDDYPLKAENFDQATNRRFQTSKTDPFASNFLAVKYHCPAETQEPEKVVFFLNQEAINLDWCRVGLCNWSDVMQHFKQINDAQCGNYYCSGSTRVAATFTLLIAAIVYLIY